MFSFDLTSLLTIASNIFTSLMPVVAIIGGLSLGLGLVGWILRAIQRLLGRG